MNTNNIKDLVNQGFEKTHKHLLDLQIWEREHTRAFYREKDDKVYLLLDYSFRHQLYDIKGMLKDGGYK